MRSNNTITAPVAERRKSIQTESGESAVVQAPNPPIDEDQQFELSRPSRIPSMKDLRSNNLFKNGSSSTTACRRSRRGRASIPPTTSATIDNTSNRTVDESELSTYSNESDPAFVPSRYQMLKTTASSELLSNGNRKATRSNTTSLHTELCSQKRRANTKELSWLADDAVYLARDPLLKLPRMDHAYIGLNNKLNNPNKYSQPQRAVQHHPVLINHIINGTDTPLIRRYYQDMPHDRHIPLAGVSRDWALERKLINSDVKHAREFPIPKLVPYAHFDPFKIHVPNHANMFTLSQEEVFNARPAVKLLIPDHIKAILVDDWENVTKNQQLVPLPAAHPVNKILKDYLDLEIAKRQPGSAEADILEEVVAGLKEYFEKCLGRILLYRYALATLIELN